jgi:hypothetical protein
LLCDREGLFLEKNLSRRNFLMTLALLAIVVTTHIKFTFVSKVKGEMFLPWHVTCAQARLLRVDYDVEESVTEGMSNGQCFREFETFGGALLNKMVQDVLGCVRC